MENRQTGQTTEQIKQAPIGSVYVWCNTHIDYPKRLAKHLNRADLLRWHRNLRPKKQQGRSAGIANPQQLKGKQSHESKRIQR